MAISFSNFTDLYDTALDFYIKSDPVSQTSQDKPTLAWLEQNAKTFPGGAGYVSGPVQITYLYDQAGFFQWYSHTDQVGFAHPDNQLRAKYLWREWHAGMVLDFTELKQRGMVVNMDGSPGSRNAPDVQIIKDWLATQVEDQGESIARARNNAFWADGTQESDAVIGLLGIFDENPTTGTIGNLNRATYPSWRHRVNLAIPYSQANQTLLRTLRREFQQLRRFGGRPSYAPCGSDAYDALRTEMWGKGLLTQTGFTGKQDATIGEMYLDGIKFVYDPTLDDLGLSKEIFVFDPKHLKLMPMAGADMTPMKATRPYDQFVLLKSITGTVAISCDQLNANGRYRMQ